MKFETAIVGGQVVFPGETTVPASIGVRDGRIACIQVGGGDLDADHVIDATGAYVTPGVVESHSHLCIGKGYEDLTTETVAALRGGVTSILFFLRHPAPYDETFQRTVAEGERRSPIDFGFHVVLLTEEHLASVPRYLREYGITSYKFYMTYRGKDAAMMDFDGKIKTFAGIDDGFMLACMRELARHPETLMMVHAENIELIQRLRAELEAAGRQDMAAWQASRPALAELEAVRRACLFATASGVRLLFFHLTTHAALEEIHRARQAHPQLFVEVCHPYLAIHDDGRLERIHKMKPPFRPRDDVEGLWAGVADGRVNTVASDHVPRPAAGKFGELWTPATGAPGTPHLLPLLIEEGFHRRRIPLERIFELASAGPARLYGLYPRKGAMMVGSDADLLVLDVDAVKTVRADEVGSCAGYSLYEGRPLRGWPRHALCKGRIAIEDGRLHDLAGWGRYLRRPATPA